MDRIFAIIPKNLFVFLVIAGGIAFLIMLQPPHTVCVSQLEVIRKTQGPFLYKDPKSKKTTTAKFERLRDHCKVTNNPGGCYELFQDIKSLLYDLTLMSRDCASHIASLSEFKKPLWEFADLIVRLAWGEKPPTSYHSKFGWLDTADISLFCKLKARLAELYGTPQWEKFREQMMKDLPGAQDLPRNQIWDMSIFSENCARYP